MLWFTSDLHLGHKNIIKHCDRPFDTVDEMNESILQNWRDTVHPSDTVYVLGDFAFMSLSNPLITDNFASLPGRKVLISGNHDPCHPMHKRHRRATRRLLEVGFSAVLTESVIQHNDDFILLSHFPYESDDRHGDKYAEYLPVDQGIPLLHGHVHTSWKVNGNQINVGVDVWNFRPVPLQTVLSLLAH